ncbi:MAG: CmpA/NrtA family ABC transporter substrate-binding protein [Hyphomicrobium sp.]
MSLVPKPGVREIHAGFIPLIDCAPFVIAKERRLDVKHGLSLVLHKEVSWANIRDKAEAGFFDCAIMLAPMPLASTLGLGGRPPVAMIAAMATSLNGNAITVSAGLYDDMLKADRASTEAGGMAAARSLAGVVANRRTQGIEPLTLGMVYPFSSHNYDLRYWLAAAGIDPVNDVNLVVVPPPLIAGSLKSGRIDGFCVGEPWNSVAVAEGSGVIVATKSDLWRASPEKVLGLSAAFAEECPDETTSLIRAVSEACAWLDEPGNRPEAAEILSRSPYIGISQDILERALTDRLVRGAGFSGKPTADVVVFSKGGANFPWVSHAVWILTQMIRWGQVRAPFDIEGVARRVYRPDLYRVAVSGLGLRPPETDAKVEGGGDFFGADRFNPDDPVTYIDGFALRDASIDLSLFTQLLR